MIPNQRLDMYNGMMSTGITADQLLLMFLASLYSTLPTPENIGVWEDIISLLDINVQKDPLTQLSELHESGIDFTPTDNIGNREAELAFISDISVMTLNLIVETRTYKKTREIVILLFLTTVSDLTRSIDQLESSDQTLKQRKKTNLTQVIHELQYKLAIDVVDLDGVQALVRNTALNQTEKIDTNTQEYMETWSLRGTYIFGQNTTLIKFVVGLDQQIQPKPVNFAKYSWHCRFTFQSEPEQKLGMSTFHVRNSDQLLVKVETSSDQIATDFVKIGQNILRDENLVDVESITKKLTNSKHLPVDLQELYKAIMVSGDGEQFLLGLCPLILDCVTEHENCMLCIFPTLTTDIISNLLENKESIEVLQEFHGTKEKKTRYLCKHHEVHVFCVKCVLQITIEDTRLPIAKCQRTLLPCWTHKRKTCTSYVCGILEQISQTIVDIALKTDRLRTNEPIAGSYTLNLQMVSYLHLHRIIKPRNLEIWSIVNHAAFISSQLDFCEMLWTDSNTDPTQRLLVQQQLMDLPEIMKRLKYNKKQPFIIPAKPAEEMSFTNVVQKTMLQKIELFLSLLLDNPQLETSMKT